MTLKQIASPNRINAHLPLMRIQAFTAQAAGGLGTAKRITGNGLFPASALDHACSIAFAADTVDTSDTELDTRILRMYMY